jgi:glycosyltransferase involved in cell wall biosynthesis
MTIVLDLQHRLQPQFPEVSANGEWLKRERHNRRWFPRASVILAGTQVGRDELKRFYGINESRVRILPHPTPASMLNAEVIDDKKALDELGLKPGYLFYPAQFWTHKNHLNLLRAIARLRDEGLAPKAVFAGADYGAERTVREAIAELNLSDQVRMLGFVDHSQLTALYRNALALTYVSFFGPENLPPLEAFALNCPVIAANVSGAQEQLGAAALLVNPADPVEIAAAIRRVSEDAPLRGQLRAAGKKRAASWTPDDFVRSAFDILDSVEAERG